MYDTKRDCFDKKRLLRWHSIQDDEEGIRVYIICKIH